MNVSEPIVNSSPDIDTQPWKGATSDRFSEILRKKKELHDQRESGQKTEVELENQSSEEFMTGPSPQSPVLADVPGARESSRAVSPSQRMEKLSAEMVDAIHSYDSFDGTRSIDIAFNSRTLEGLHVRIQSRNGELSIQFATQSDQVAKLLSQHTERLNQTLESRGLRVRGITVAGTSSSSGPYQAGQLSNWRGQ